MGKFKQFSPNVIEPKQKKGLLKEETLNYYRRVSQSLEEGFQNEEDKSLFVNNVMSQLSEEAVSVAQNQTASRIIEVLLSVCDQGQLHCLLTAFSQDWNTVCTDRFASHVLQKLLLTVPGHLSKSREITSDKVDGASDVKSLEELVIEFCEFIETNIEEFVTHTYASHIVRVMLEVVGGVSVEEKLIRSKLSRGQNKDQTDTLKNCDMCESIQEKLLSLSESIMSLDNLEGYLTETLSTTVIQTVLLVLHKRQPQICEQYCQKVLQVSGLSDTEEDNRTSSDLPSLVRNVCGSYLVEQLLALSSEPVHQNIISKVFLTRALHFAVDPRANFVLQRVFTTIRDVEQFKQIFKELSPHVEDILAIHHLGVICKMAETCQRLACYQNKFVKCIQKAFHCYKPADRQTSMVQLLTSLSTYEVFYKPDAPVSDKGEEAQPSSDKIDLELFMEMANDLSSVMSSTRIFQSICLNFEPIYEIVFPQIFQLSSSPPNLTNYHGSLTVQHMLKFEDPSPVVNSLISMDASQLLQLASNQCGSHIIDAFYQSKTVSGNRKEQMIQKLKGCILELACSKNGSRALQAIWDFSSLKQKTGLAEELSKHESRLQGDKFGRFIHRNFAIYHFIHRRKDWRELQGAKIKKRKMFEDILEESGSGLKNYRKGNNSGKDSLRLSLPEKDEGGDQSFGIGDMFRVKSDHRPSKGQNKRQHQKSHKQFPKKKPKLKK